MRKRLPDNNKKSQPDRERREIQPHSPSSSTFYCRSSSTESDDPGRSLTAKRRQARETGSLVIASASTFEKIVKWRITKRRSKRRRVSASNTDDDDHYKVKKRSCTHNCTECGTSFDSGQALGGHMKAHRRCARLTSTHVQKEDPKISINIDLNKLPPMNDEEASAWNSLL